MADNHTIYKNGAKEIAHLNGCSITFMAKPDHTWIGSSCHIHASLWRDGGTRSAVARRVKQFLAGWIAGAKEMAIFLAPTINSYKRYAAGSWAPTTLAWGHDNRTCGFRIVGHGAAQRIETRIPGGDVNPYLAFAALIAAGLHGIERGSSCRPRWKGTRTSPMRRGFRRRCGRRSRRSSEGDRAGGARRRRRRSLPQLRAHRAASLRRGRDVLRAGAAVRTWLDRHRHHDVRRSGEVERLGPKRRSFRRLRDAVERAGGRALLVPPSEDGVEETLQALDGLMFSGGSDLDPELYDQEPHEETFGIERTRHAPSSRSSRLRSSATCPCSRSAVAARC